MKYTNQLIDAIDKRVGTPINMTTWLNYLSFDVMGDMAFGKSFDMLTSGQDAYLLKQVHYDMKMVGLFSHLTWLFPFFKRTPGINAEYLKQWNWIDSQVQERAQVGCDSLRIPSLVLIPRESRIVQRYRTCFHGSWMHTRRAQKPSKTI